MNTKRWKRLSSLYEAIGELPPERRAQQIAEILRENPTVATDLIDMLESGVDTVEIDTASQVAPDLLSDMLTALIGTVFGAYRITGSLGAGGMGVVFRAVRDDSPAQEEVALKLLPQDERPPAAREAGHSEARVLASLHHPNIARFIDYFAVGNGAYCLVQELVEGSPLNHWLAANQPTPRRVAALLADVCAAVAYAHSKLVLHCDIKPSNIVVNRSGQPILVDFGIARVAASAHLGEDNSRSPTPQSAPAHGTRQFTAPEALSQRTVSVQSDVFSLGCVCADALRRLGGSNGHGPRAPTLTRQTFAELFSSREKLAAIDLAQVAEVACRAQPSARFVSASQMQEALLSVSQGHTPRASASAYRLRWLRLLMRQRALLVMGLLSIIAISHLFIERTRERDRALASEQLAVDSLQLLQDYFRDANTLNTFGRKLPPIDRARLIVRRSREIDSHALALHLPTLQNLAAAAIENRQIEAAALLTGRARELTELSSDPLDLLRTRLLQAQLAIARGEPEETIRRNFEIQKQLTSAWSIEGLRIRQQAAWLAARVELDRDHLMAAEAWLRLAEWLAERSGPSGQTDLLFYRIQLATLLHATQRSRSARLRLHDAALVLDSLELESRHFPLLRLAVQLALGESQFGLAEHLAQRMLDTNERHYRDNYPARLNSLRLLSLAKRYKGDTVAADALLRQMALETVERAADEIHVSGWQHTMAGAALRWHGGLDLPPETLRALRSLASLGGLGDFKTTYRNTGDLSAAVRVRIPPLPPGPARNAGHGGPRTAPVTAPTP